jgi:dsDNA-specific endonuclease/ATPase MutS2
LPVPRGLLSNHSDRKDSKNKFLDFTMVAPSDSEEYPINGTLDLHTFPPDQVKPLVHDYIDACLDKEIYQLRIIHGKGKGTLRRIVHAQLEKNEHVENFRLAGSGGGSWGATVVDLKQ